MNTLITNRPVMNTLQVWSHSAGAKALGWALAHFVWEGAAIAAVLAVVLAIFRGSSARLRYGLACAALAAMPIVFGVTVAVSLPHSAARTIIRMPLPEPSRVEFQPAPQAPPESFIEQFWKRRDPTPDTERNEYREEHYRRIAYTNEHFKTYIPGWKTDRGRVYIMYGPPDEIESHPAGEPISGRRKKAAERQRRSLSSSGAIAISKAWATTSSWSSSTAPGTANIA